MEFFGKGVPLSTGFDLSAQKPLDNRTVVDTIEERNQHVLLNRAYEGLVVYVKETKKEYRYDGTSWIDCTSINIDFSNYYDKNEVNNLLSNVEDKHYFGEEEPTEDKIWYSSNSNIESGFNHDNPLIIELFNCINSLQEQVKKLQDEVEYLKLHGGGGSTPDIPDLPDIPVVPEDDLDYCLLLEDGSPLLWEDGSYILLEEYKETEDLDYCLLLEDGSPLLWEDGSLVTLEGYKG